MPKPKLDACLFTVRTSDFYGYSRIPSIYLQRTRILYRQETTHTHTHMYGRHNNNYYYYYYYYYYYATTTNTLLLLLLLLLQLLLLLY